MGAGQLLGPLRLLGAAPNLERHAELPRKRGVWVRELPLDVVPDRGRPTSVADEFAEGVPQRVVDAEASDILPGVGHKRRVRLIITLWQQVTPQLRLVSRRGGSVSGLIHGSIVGTFGPTSDP